MLAKQWSDFQADQDLFMKSNEIVALRCPSCGEGITQPSREMPFGAEFRCDACGITSVLIINRALLPVDALQKSGDQVCAVCGRVAKLDARFCQDGHKLVRSCLNQDCGKEFSAHHLRCDYCGWLQDVIPGTPEAYELVLDHAIEDLLEAAKPGSSEDETWRALNKIGSIEIANGRGKRAIPAIINLLHIPRLLGTKFEISAWTILARMGTDSVEAVPLLLRRINETGPGWWFNGEDRMGLWFVLAMIAPQEVLRLCRNAIEASGKNGEGYSLGSLYSVLDMTWYLGNAAIPMLTEFTGLFSGDRGRRCQAVIDKIRNGDVYTTL